MAPRWNYEEEKVKYFQSNYMTPAEYWKNVNGIDTSSNGTVGMAIVGWFQEKKNFQKDVQRKAREEFEEKKKDQWLKVFENIDIAHRKGLNDLATDLVNGETEVVETYTNANGQLITKKYKIKLGVGEKLSIMKHFKLEKGEATELNGTGEVSSLQKLYDKEIGDAEHISEE